MLLAVEGAGLLRHKCRIKAVEHMMPKATQMSHKSPNV